MHTDRTEGVEVIRVRLVRHTTPGLLVAVSDDLRGLMVAGRSEAEIENKLAGAVREIMEAKGRLVLSVTTGPDHTGISTEFAGSALIANVELAAA